jgi:hypothetical protein
MPQEGSKPHLVTSLPNSPSAPGSIRYFHEHTSLNAHYYLSSDNILNLRRESRCVLARYDSGRVLCVQYTSPTAAERGYGGLVRDYAPGLAETEVVQVAEGNWLTARRRESLLIVVLEATSETAALELLTACESTISTPQTHEVK